MSKGTLGSFNGTTTANVNMLDIFKQNEMAAHENSTLAFTDHMVIKKIGIQCEAGTEVIINGCEILLCLEYSSLVLVKWILQVSCSKKRSQ